MWEGKLSQIRTAVPYFAQRFGLTSPLEDLRTSQPAAIRRPDRDRRYSYHGRLGTEGGGDRGCRGAAGVRRRRSPGARLAASGRPHDRARAGAECVAGARRLTRAHARGGGAAARLPDRGSEEQGGAGGCDQGLRRRRIQRRPGSSAAAGPPYCSTSSSVRARRSSTRSFPTGRR